MTHLFAHALALAQTARLVLLLLLVVMTQQLLPVGRVGRLCRLLQHLDLLLQQTTTTTRLQYTPTTINMELRAFVSI